MQRRVSLIDLVCDFKIDKDTPWVGLLISAPSKINFHSPSDRSSYFSGNDVLVPT